MGWYLLRRLGTSAVTLFLATIVIFIGVRALPGGPAVALSAETSNPAVIAQIRHRYGLDKPLPTQYVRWIEQAAQGNFGISPKTGIPVGRQLLQRLPVTAELTLVALLIALVLGLPIGILAAIRRNSIADYICTSAALVGLSVPHFWLGLLFILGLSVHLGLLPSSGYVPFTENPLGNIAHIIMPAFTLAMGLTAIIMRQMRSAMLETLNADYIRTARAKGLSESRTVLIHALRNSLTTVVTIVGLQVGTLMSGAIITEQIFLIPGLGRLTVQSAFSRDYPALQGIVLIAATSYIVANLLTDLAYSWLNPRVRMADSSS